VAPPRPNGSGITARNNGLQNDQWNLSEMSNEAFQAAIVIAVVVEAAVAAWALARRDLTAVVLLNALGAAGVLLDHAPEFGLIVRGLDWNFLLLLSFELAALATSVLWFAWRAPSWLVWTAFSVHALLSLALLIFAFTFKLNRLM
jgi:hypothetical protein